MGTLDAVACAAEYADPAVNIPDPYGLWAPTEEMTSCGYFGEAVEPTVDLGPLVGAHTYDKGGMPLIWWVATAHGVNDCMWSVRGVEIKSYRLVQR